MSDEKGQIGFAMDRPAALQKTKEDKEARKRSRMATVKTGSDAPSSAKLEAVVAEAGDELVELAHVSEAPRQSRPFETDDTQKTAAVAPVAEPVIQNSPVLPSFPSKNKTIEARVAPPSREPAAPEFQPQSSYEPGDGTEDDGTSRTMEMALPTPIVRDSRPSPAPPAVPTPFSTEPTAPRNPFERAKPRFEEGFPSMGRVLEGPSERVILTPEEPVVVPPRRRPVDTDTEPLMFRMVPPRTFKIGTVELTVPDLVTAGAVIVTLLYVFIR